VPAQPAKAADLDALYPAAKQEGKVVFYTGGTEVFTAGVVDRFKQKYPGIEVEVVASKDMGFVQRVTAENASGQFVGDVVSDGATTMGQLVADKRFAKWSPPDLDMMAVEIENDGGLHWSLRLNVHGFLVNTQLVPENKVPKVQKDLLDPFWKGEGKLLLGDPRNQSSGGGSLLVVAYRDLGKGFLQALADQKPTFTRESKENAQKMVARGEFAGYAPSKVGVALAELEKSAPIKQIFLQDSTIAEEASIGVLEKAPHPNAARLWAGFLFTAEGQTEMVTSGLQYGVRKGIPGPVGSPSLDTISNVKMRTADERARNDEFLKVFDETLFK
jgi:iron(III) transport system substrate-binding protein